MTVDTQALLGRIDLRELVARDVRLRRRGQELHGPCPWCGGGHGDRSDRFRVNRDGQSWHCRQCGKGGDAIDYLRQRHGLDFLDACIILGASRSELGNASNFQPRPVAAGETADRPPSPTWQARVRERLVSSTAALFGPSGQHYRFALHARGITDATAHIWQLGYCATPLAGPPAWPRGLVIPWLDQDADVVWGIKIRQPNGVEPKYWALAGSNLSGLFGAETLLPGEPVMLVESELDAILLWQTLGDYLGVVSAGGKRPHLRPRALETLAVASSVYVCYDNEPEAQQVASELAATDPRFVVAPPPTGYKDPTEAFQSGVDLRRYFLTELGA